MTQHGAAAARALRRALPLALALSIGGCKKEDLGATGVRLEVHTADVSLMPSALVVQWFDENARLLSTRVPQNGRLAEATAANVSVYISMDDRTLGPRRVLVHGLSGPALTDDDFISEGAMRLMPVAGQWTGFSVQMEPKGTLADTDHDLIPDEIDNCPTRPDPCADEPDGGAPDGPAPPDGGADRSVPPDGGADRADGPAPDAPPDVAPPPDVPFEKPGPFNGNGTGVRGDYFDNPNLSTYRTSRLDPKIDFDWMNGSPIAGVGIDTFSIRWLGSVQPRYSEVYTFYVVCDDGVRLFLNNTMLIDGWAGPAKMEFMGVTAAPLVAGDKYDFKVEYFENTGGASCHVSWSSPSQPKEVIPTSQLYPAPGDGGV